MDVQEATVGERMLRRIAALLLSFALVAERAATRSWPVRCFLLWILRRADAIASDFVFDVTGMPYPHTDAIGAVGNDPDDAMLLGLRFRVLAAMLGALLPDACLDDAFSGAGGPFHHLASSSFSRLAVVFAGGMPEPNDTS